MSAYNEQQHRNASDQALVESAKAGQLQAFGELVERTQALARAVAYGASGDLDSVEDLVQEALVTAWTRLPDLSDPSAFRPWLAGIVRNTVRYWRRHQRRHAPRAQAGMDALRDLADTGPSPLEAAQERQDWRQASHALQSLPSKYREPLLMYYALGESHALVAEALGLSEAATRQRVHRARKKLASEVHRVEVDGRSIAARASAAAAVVLLLESRNALAAATPAASQVATTSPTVFLGLGALGGAAIVAAIAALVMLLGSESTSLSAAGLVPSVPRTGEQARPAPRSTNSPSEVFLSPPEGVVRIGTGRVHDPKVETPLKTKNYSEFEPTTQKNAVRKQQHGTIRKHGPAKLLPENEVKPLLQPDIDMQAVNREMWSSN